MRCACYHRGVHTAADGISAPAALGVKRLAVAETLAWGFCYYSFPALLPHWEAALGWSRSSLTGALTVALLLSAIIAPVMGSLIDRGHGRLVMVGGTALAGVGMAGLAATDSVWWFYGCWALLGLGMAGCLYEPCFAVITRRRGDQAKPAIITVTLFAGFAGTLCFPVTHALMLVGDWQTTCLVFAGLIGIAGGLMAWAIGPDRAAELPAAPAGARSGVQAALRSPVFWLIALASMMISLNHGALISHIMPLLADRGIEQHLAVLAASMIGPMQVVGRLAMMAAGTRAPTPAVAVASFVGTTAAAAALLSIALGPVMVAAFVVLQGACYGVVSIVRPALIAEWLGRRGFGAITGALAIPFTAGYAASPTVAAAVEAYGGYDCMLVAVLGCSLVGLVAIIIAWRLVISRSSAPPAASGGTV